MNIEQESIMPKRLTLEQKVRAFVQVSALAKVTKEDVASYFKVAPSSISRIFDKLISEGIIAKPEKIILEIYPILAVNDNGNQDSKKAKSKS